MKALLRIYVALAAICVVLMCLAIYSLHKISTRLDHPIYVVTDTHSPPSADEIGSVVANKIASAIALEMGAPTRFEFHFINWDLHHASFRIVQSGPPASALAITSEPGIRATLSDDFQTIRFEPENDQLPSDSHWRFSLAYLDPHGERHSRDFNVVAAPRPRFFDVTEIKQ